MLLEIFIDTYRNELQCTNPKFIQNLNYIGTKIID